MSGSVTVCWRRGAVPGVLWGVPAVGRTWLRSALYIYIYDLYQLLLMVVKRKCILGIVKLFYYFASTFPDTI